MLSLFFKPGEILFDKGIKNDKVFSRVNNSTTGLTAGSICSNISIFTTGDGKAPVCMRILPGVSLNTR